MQRTLWVWCFAIFVCLDLLAISWGNMEWRYISKPLILISLFIFFRINAKGHSRLHTLLYGALTCSLLGDVFHMFEARNEVFFVLALVFFLTAHLFYISFYLTVRKKQAFSKVYPLLILLPVVYGAIVYYLLFPDLEGFRMPIAFYMVIISLMVISAIHAFPSFDSLESKLSVSGAILFILSNTIVAIDKFYLSFIVSDILVMTTYSLAQLFIVAGAIVYFNKKAPD